MTEIKLLQVYLELPIAPSEIGAFRKAIAKKAGYEHDVYHNHKTDGSRFHRYPLVQYKRNREQASLLFITEDAVGKAHELFKQSDWTLDIAGKQRRMFIDNLELRQHRFAIADEMKYRYHLFNWIALNDKNYKIYNKKEGLIERITFLQEILVKHIVGVAINLGWEADKKIAVKIMDVSRQKLTHYKEMPFLAFDISFRSNAFLPYYIGLGKAVSHGYGTIYPS